MAEENKVVEPEIPANEPQIDETPAANEPYWKEDWRQRLAGEDQKALKRLERFGSPEDIYKSYRSMEQKLSSGELKPNAPFPEKGTPEQQNQWRKDHGIPESFDKYEIKLPDGVVIGDDDKVPVEEFLKRAHAKNMSAEHASAAIAAYMDWRDTEMQKRQEAKDVLVRESEDALRNEWGQEYRKNLSLVDGMLSETMASEDLRADLGEAIKVSPEFAKWLVGMARMINPEGTIVPSTAGTQVESVQEKVNALLKLQNENPKAFFDQGGFAELTKWNEALARLQKRAA